MDGRIECDDAEYRSKVSYEHERPGLELEATSGWRRRARVRWPERLVRLTYGRAILLRMTLLGMFA